MFRWLLLSLIAAAPLFAQDDVRRGFDQLAQVHSAHMKVEPLGGAFVATIRDQAVKQPLPAVLLIGSVHGYERAPGEACLRIARDLLEDKAFRDMLSKVEIIVIPLPNAEGRRAGVNGVLLARDDDRDGKADEDGPSDLNGDGVISQMRVRGNTYVQTEAGVLIAAEPGKTGEWDLYWEGKDDDGDGRINEDARGTVALANDWSIRWDDKHAGANRFMMQLAETRALADFISARPNVFAAFQLRSIGGAPAFAQGPKVQGKDSFQRDKDMATALVKLWGEAKPGEHSEGAGNILDWLYESRGVHAANVYLAELPTNNEEGEEKPKRKVSEDEARQLAWKAYTPTDYVEWKAFKHPQLGDVEIGGWRINARSNPLEADAIAGATRAANFVKAVARAAPRLEVGKVEKEDKGEGLYRVRLTVRNAGALDYRTAFSDDRKIHLPIFVSLKDVADIKLVSGTRRVKQENILSGETATFEWLVSVDKQVEFQLESDRCGPLSHAVDIRECPNIVTEEE
jgi:hypothetical protein